MRIVKKRVGEQFRYYPLSDVHWPDHEEGYLKQWRDLVEKDDKAIVTLGGDLFDFSRTALRTHLGSYRKDKNSMRIIHDHCLAEVDRFVEFLEPIKGKIVGAIAGNHHNEFPDGQISDQKLALALGSKWFGAMGLVQLRMKGGAIVVILVHHDGGSGARTPGADFNAFHRVAQNAKADIIALGHTHRLYAVPGSMRITVDEDGKISADKTIFIRSGSYLKRYHEIEAGEESEPYAPEYGEEKLYAPSTLGHCYVGVSANRKRVHYKLITEVA
jgi:predicted phosphodiesterase